MPGTPFLLSIVAGNFQTAPIDSTFATNLQVLVTDINGVAVPSAPVTFVVPSFGPSGTFTGSTATFISNSSGIATATVLRANLNIGSYSVLATNPNTSLATFSLVNSQSTLIPSYFAFDSWSTNYGGASVPGAQYFFVVNDYPNIPSTLAQGGMGPLIPVYADVNGEQELNQPLITDGFGFCSCFIAPQLFTVLIYLNGSLKLVIPDQSVGLGNLLN